MTGNEGTFSQNQNTPRQDTRNISHTQNLTRQETGGKNNHTMRNHLDKRQENIRSHNQKIPRQDKRETSHTARTHVIKIQEHILTKSEHT